MRAQNVGTLRHAKYSLDSSRLFLRAGNDLMLGIVNKKLDKMQLFKLDGFDTKIDQKFDSDFTNIKSKDYEVRIELYGANGISLAV